MEALSATNPTVRWCRIVVTAGSDVSRVRVGDRVAPIFYPNWLDGQVAPEKMEMPLGGAVADGVLAEYTLLNEQSVIHVPEHLSDEEAATLPCAAVTAWNSVVSSGQITPGDTVVVLGTGGVSLFAMHFAKLLGARVIVTSSCNQKLARAKELGAAEAVNYAETPDWPRSVMEMTDGIGADHIIDTVGNLKPALAAVRLGGTVAFVGLLAGMSADVDLVTFMGKSARVQAVDVGSRQMFEDMNKAIQFHKLRPVVDRVFGFSELGAALSYLGTRKHMGKICLRV
jgi:NADPH:quinone reductase-like Zn-dependent oxidoreductase